MKTEIDTIFETAKTDDELINMCIEYVEKEYIKLNGKPLPQLNKDATMWMFTGVCEREGKKELKKIMKSYKILSEKRNSLNLSQGYA